MSDYTFKMPNLEVPTPTGEIVELSEDLETLTSQLLKTLGMKNSIARNATEIAVMQIPVVGELLSTAEAINLFSKGDIVNGLANTAFAIPIIGSKLRLGRTAVKGLGLTKKANLIKKINLFKRKANKVGKYAQYGVNGYWGTRLGSEVYNSFMNNDEPSYIAEKDATYVKPSYSNFLEDLKKE